MQDNSSTGTIERLFALDAVSEEQWRSLWLTAQDVDPNLVMLLEEIPPAQDAFDQLERIGAGEKVIGWAQARQYAEITRFVADSVAEPSHGMSAEQAGESAQAQVGLMLTLAPGGAAWRVSEARTLVEEFPATFAALQSGAITLVTARIIVEGCADVGVEVAAVVQARVLPRAPRQTCGQLRAAVAWVVKREDAAAAEAVGVFAVVDQHARACGGADGRSMHARRADALTDLVLGGTGFCSAGGTETGPAVVDDEGDGAVLAVAPAPGRLPGVAPTCGARTATTGVSGPDPGDRPPGLAARRE